MCAHHYTHQWAEAQRTMSATRETTTNRLGEILVNGDGVIELHTYTFTRSGPLGGKCDESTHYMGRTEAVELIGQLVSLLSGMDPKTTEETVTA